MATGDKLVTLDGLKSAYDSGKGMIALDYANLTFPVIAGTYCIYGGALYYAKQDIASSEAWTAAHWQTAKVGQEVADLKSTMSAMDTATASDEGKALKAKTVTDGKVTEWEFGEAGGGTTDPSLTHTGEAADAKAAGDKLCEITGRMNINPDSFDIGNISISNSGWTYSSSSARVRTKENVTLHLEKNTIIKLTDYTNARYYLGWKYESGGSTVYSSSGGWRTFDTVAPVTGDYVILISAVPEATVSDKMALIDLLRIQAPAGDLPSLDKTIGNFQTVYGLGGYIPIDYSKFEVGSLSITNSGWADQNNEKRVKTNRLTPIHLPKGVRIGLTDYSDYRYYVGWLYNGSYGMQGWNSCDFITPYEADYVITIAHINESSAPYLIYKDALLKLLYFKTESGEAIGLNSNIIIPSGPRIIAHRGDMVNAPENSVPAFTLAGQAHVWGIETDIWETSDGYFVCIHDQTVDGTTDGTGKVTEKTLAQVQELTIDAGPNISQYPDLKIPTLEQYIAVCKRYGAMAITEIKGITHYADFLAYFVDAGMIASVMFLVWYESDVNALRKAGFKGPIAMIHNSTFNSAAVASDAKWPNLWMDVNRAKLSASVIQEAHNANIPVISYSASTKADALADLEAGADIITTNGIYNLDD